MPLLCIGVCSVAAVSGLPCHPPGAVTREESSPVGCCSCPVGILPPLVVLSVAGSKQINDSHTASS